MKEDLLGLITRELLDKFGAGNHKPGSGSAAAFQGMISAKLLVTVIELTNDISHRQRYIKSLPQLLEVQCQINERIYPELVKLFEEDSVQFGKTIELRKLRDSELDLINKNKLAKKALQELKIAIQIPLDIANLCIELSRMASVVFDKAFQSARGDSQVALSGAVSALAGCLSIVNLNLLSFKNDEYDWVQEVALECNRLKEHHNELNKIANAKIDKLAFLVKSKASFYKDINNLLNGVRSGKKLTTDDIEHFTSNLQNLVWKNRETIWKENNVPADLMEILKPAIVFKKVLNYNYLDNQDLGSDYVENKIVDIAGIIDQDNKIVQISNHTSFQVQNFTAAHELGHALMHKQTVLHRDIPIDGSYETTRRPMVEIQADRFASCFLMPKKLVEQRFKEIFLTEEFRINEDTTFKFTGTTAVNLRKECKTLRELCRKLATAKSYDGEFFMPMSELFNVSVEAMAIRLEQLGLVKY